MPVQVLSPASSAHDGSEQSSTTTGSSFSGPSPGTVEFADTLLRFGNQGIGRNIYIKFPLPTTGWLSGKIINNVTLGLSCEAGAGYSTTVAARLFLEKTANPADIVAGVGTFSLSGRTKTSISMTIDNSAWGAWTAGLTYSYSLVNGVSIKQMLEEVMGAVGAVNISSIGLYFNYINPAAGERVANAFGTSPIPTLSIDYGFVSKRDTKRIKVLWRDSRRASA